MRLGCGRRRLRIGGFLSVWFEVECTDVKQGGEKIYRDRLIHPSRPPA